MTTTTSTKNQPSSTHRAWRMKDAAKSATNVADLNQVLELQADLQRPTLAPGQVLVKVAVCTLNDEDRFHVTNDYINSRDIPMPRAVGFEGAGVVVASAVPWYLAALAPAVGTRVAFYASKGNALTEYMVVQDPMSLIPIPDGVSYQVAASAVTNAFTVKLMADRIYRQGHKAVVNTVPAGALGRLFTKYCSQTLGITVIGTVRRDAQKQLILADGAKYALNMKDQNFSKQLSRAIQETDCHFAYDGLGGDMPNTLLQALPKHSTVSIYSHIAGEIMPINALHWFGKTLETFNAGDEAKTLWTWTLLGVVSQLQAWMTKPDMATKIRTSYRMDELPQALVDSTTGNKTDGKVQVIVDASLLDA